jgi:flagellar hook-associated protein 2
MATISSPGIGSGLDVNSLVTQLMSVERQPLVEFDKKEAQFQGVITAYGTIKSALSTFQTAVHSLNDLSKFQAFKATAGDATILSATATSAAVPGIYSVEVKQLASSQKLASKPFTNVTDTVGSGTLTFQFGTYDGGVFTANAAKTVQTVSIGNASNSLTGIRDAINAAKIGVSASILNDGNGNKLVLTSNDTGAANSLKITVNGDSDGVNGDDSGLSQLAYDPAGALGNGKNLTQTVAAQNALLKVDGVDNISKASNAITDVIQGVTLNLSKASALNTPTTLTVARDTGSVKSSIDAFVKAYNDLNAKFADLTSYDPQTKKAGLLQGDVSVLSTQSQIRRTLGAPIGGFNGAFTSLTQIGIAFQKDGTLAVDATKLQNAMDNNFNDIAGLFTAIGRPSDSLIKYVSATDKTVPGNYLIGVTTLATQSVLNGATTATLADTNGVFTSPVTIDASNDNLSVKIDGVNSSAITLAQGTYSSAASLIAEIQSRINGDTALKGAGISVIVTFDGASDRLVLTSSRYGESSAVEVTSVDPNTSASLGLSVATGVGGADVAGTINGEIITGSGRFLTGVGRAEGLKLEVTGGLTGDRGSVDFSRGYAQQLDALVTRILASDGPIAARTDGVNRSIEDINERREVLNRRLELVEQRYRAQFSSLDGLLTSMRGTSDFLTRQLETLSNLFDTSSN